MCVLQYYTAEHDPWLQSLERGDTVPNEAVRDLDLGLLLIDFDHLGVIDH